MISGFPITLIPVLLSTGFAPPCTRNPRSWKREQSRAAPGSLADFRLPYASRWSMPIPEKSAQAVRQKEQRDTQRILARGAAKSGRLPGLTGEPRDDAVRSRTPVRSKDVETPIQVVVNVEFPVFSRPSDTEA